ncbi:MAG: UDP-3-O-acyl-N-acetylglucosamine deacetylase [Pseudomonadota bacterium]
MSYILQGTLRKSIKFTGVGLHSGVATSATVFPAPAGTGIVFQRMDVPGDKGLLPAKWDSVVSSPLCTRLVNDHDISLSTIEHLMAALVGCGIHNARIHVTAGEVPIMDGSASVFVKGFLQTGIRHQDAPVHAIKVLKPVEVRRGDAVARIAPNDTLLIEFDIDFEDAAIGAQSKTLNMSNGSFVRELSASRTFCRQADVDHMQANGLALGGAPGENAVVFDGDEIVSPGGLRHTDEPVRHKMLDALGDLGLAGYPILGHYQGIRAGHALTNDLLRALFADSEAFEIVECDADMVALLPGAGVHLGELPEVA